MLPLHGVAFMASYDSDITLKFVKHLGRHCISDNTNAYLEATNN